MAKAPLGDWRNPVIIKPGKNYNLAGREITIVHDWHREDGEHLVEYYFRTPLIGEVFQGSQWSTVENFCSMILPPRYDGEEGEVLRLSEWLESISKLIEPADIPLSGMHPEVPFYAEKLRTAVLHARAALNGVHMYHKEEAT